MYFDRTLHSITEDTAAQQFEVRRLEDGSIDYAYHKLRARSFRTQAISMSLKVVIRLLLTWVRAGAAFR